MLLRWHLCRCLLWKLRKSNPKTRSSGGFLGESVVYFYLANCNLK